MINFLQKLFSTPLALAETTADKGNIATQTGDQVQNLINGFILSIPLWITGFIVIIISFILAKIVKSAVENRMTIEGLEEEHREIQIVASRGASAAVLIIGITVGLKVAGIDLTGIVAAAAFGIGFAMQDIIMNFLSGIILLLQKQFTIGDWIKVNGTEGVVKEIQSRYTIIKKWDGTKAIIPNAELFKNQVINLTGNPERRLQFVIGVDLYADLKEVIDTIYQSISRCDKILAKPKPSIIVVQPGDYCNNLKVRCWVDSRKGILMPTSSVLRQIHKDFYRKGWSWPYPTQTLIFDKDVPPDVNARTKDYMEKHKAVLSKNHLKNAPLQALQQFQQIESSPQIQPITQSEQDLQAKLTGTDANQVPNLGIIYTNPPQPQPQTQVPLESPQPTPPLWLQNAVQSSDQQNQNLPSQN